jgi:hypothetical protein
MVMLHRLSHLQHPWFFLSTIIAEHASPLSHFLHCYSHTSCTLCLSHFLQLVFYQNNYYLPATAVTCSFDGFNGATLNGLTTGPQLLKQALLQLTSYDGMSTFVKQSKLPCGSQFALLMSDNSECQGHNFGGGVVVTDHCQSLQDTLPENQQAPLLSMWYTAEFCASPAHVVPLLQHSFLPFHPCCNPWVGFRQAGRQAPIVHLCHLQSCT